MPERPPKTSQRITLAVIIGGLVVWALYVAIGVFLHNFNIIASLIVLGCMAAFVGFWLLLLRTTGGDKER